VAQHALLPSNSPLAKTPHKARVVSVALMATVVTLLQMAAQDSGPADLDRAHDTALRHRQRSAIVLTIGFAVVAKHIRHLKLRAIHFPELARSTVVERARAQRQPAAGADQGGWQWSTLCW